MFNSFFLFYFFIYPFIIFFCQKHLVGQIETSPQIPSGTPALRNGHDAVVLDNVCLFLAEADSGRAKLRRARSSQTRSPTTERHSALGRLSK